MQIHERQVFGLGHQLLSYIRNKLREPLTHRVLQNFPPDRGFVPGYVDIRPWLEKASNEKRDLHIYLSIPFCTYKGVNKEFPEKCGFCLFPSVPFSRKALHRYMDVLVGDELPAYAEYFGRSGAALPVDSIFLGGGTPNTLSEDLYARLLETVFSLFRVKPEVEVTTEGAPELYTDEKLRRFKQLGGTRVSFGVQQFNDDLLPLSGRRVSKSRVGKLIGSAVKEGFSVSVDIIYGWPDQTVERFLAELRDLHSLGANRITAYPLNINRPSYFSTILRHRIPCAEEIHIMYRRSRDLLISLGYTPVTLNDYEIISSDGARPHTLRHEQAMRTDHLSYRIGIGYAGLTKLLFHEDGLGITYRNYSKREEGLMQYLNGSNQYRFPVESHFLYKTQDLLMNYISGSLQTFRIDLKDLRRNFPSFSFEDEFGSLVLMLELMGWLAVGEDAIDLNPKGAFYTHIIQGAFFMRRIQELRQSGSIGLPLSA